MATVVTGLERLARSGPGCAGLSTGARVGLLAHAASIDATARHAVERIRETEGLRLERILAPEHGLYGHEQDMEPVDGTTDPATGLPVASLYGRDKDSLRPSPDLFAGLDALIFDCQDVGSRYYTYLTTLCYVMRAAGSAGVPVVVLDRPNPIGGERVEGPLLHEAFESFVGLPGLPVRHGMTAGELAGLFRDEQEAACDLRVVEMQGWSRSMAFEQCGLPWVPPSPNMPSTATARVYPGGCLIEGTNLSEGRGTTTPFELVGAPWLDGHALAEAMRSEGLAGAAFRAASFRPSFQKHAGLPCGGLQVIVREPGRFEPFEVYLVLLREVLRAAPGDFAWRTEAYEFERDRLAIDLLLGIAGLRPMLEAAAPLAEMRASWSDALAEFRERRRRWLLY